MSAAQMTPADASADTADREIVLTRVFDAPRELVWEAWTHREHVDQWWGPRAYVTTTKDMDVRVGGVWRFTMEGMGKTYPNRIAYTEIVRPERLAYDVGSSDESPAEFHSTVTFDEEGGGTRVTMRLLLPSAEARRKVVDFGAIEGGKETLERLGEHLARMSGQADPFPPFVVTREFAAPRDLVFRAWTEAEHLDAWWGPKGFRMLRCTNDLRPGGVMLYGMEGPGGSVMWGKWVYREIVAPERLAFVVSFSDEHGGTTRAPFSGEWPLEILSTITFEERDGRTTLTMVGEPVNATEAERRTFLSGHGSMTAGWGATLDQLEAYLPTVQAS
ncbi:MAG TPA: SRPBCC family protein [Longimicrobium sp.]|nr:SRPBCC family protein [Longimicrobium sp.]